MISAILNIFSWLTNLWNSLFGAAAFHLGDGWYYSFRQILLVLYLIFLFLYVIKFFLKKPRR